MTLVHHSAICTRDIDASLAFWRDGLGFEVTMDLSFDGDWTTLFAASGNVLRSVFLGDPHRPDAGTIELVAFPSGIDDGAGPQPAPSLGFFLLSCFVDVDATLTRLAELGLGGEPTRIEQMGVQMATVRDPNGVLVELIEARTART